MRLNQKLIEAASRRDYKEVECECSKSAIDKESLNHALCVACDSDDQRAPTEDLFKIVDCLIAKGADINAEVQGRAPLSWALSLRFVEDEEKFIPFINHLLLKDASPFISTQIRIWNRFEERDSIFKMPIEEGLNYFGEYRCQILKIIVQRQEQMIASLILAQIEITALFPTVLSHLIAIYAVEVINPREQCYNQQDFNLFKRVYPQIPKTWTFGSFFGWDRDQMKKLLAEEKIRTMREVKDYISKNPNDENIKQFMKYEWRFHTPF